MDNVTHSLAGLLAAEAAVRLRARSAGAEPSARFRAAAAISSLVAANLPDFDLLYTGFGGDHLAYMLHHRGYTHTVVGAVLGATLLWGIAVAVWRWRWRAAPAPDDSRWLLALVFVSTVGHLALDWTNSYGVHLFWPFDDRWQYGDAVFIVEPWFWVVTVPVLVAATTSRAARVLLALVLLAGLVLAWRVPLVTSGAAAALTAGAALSIVLARVPRPGRRAAVAVAGWVVVTIVMGAGAARARASVRRAVRAADPAAEVLDVVVTPLPANALCATAITVERSRATYRVATARVSAAPSVVSASACGAARDAGPLFRASARRSTPAVRWGVEWAERAAELARLARESCPALAALRFIRVPAWRAVDDSTVLLGDVRYGGASGHGFSDVRVPRRTENCPAEVPPWTPPRADLLGNMGPLSAPADPRRALPVAAILEAPRQPPGSHREGSGWSCSALRERRPRPGGCGR